MKTLCIYHLRRIRNIWSCLSCHCQCPFGTNLSRFARIVFRSVVHCINCHSKLSTENEFLCLGTQHLIKQFLAMINYHLTWNTMLCGRNEGISKSYVVPGNSVHNHINPIVLPSFGAEILRFKILKLNLQIVTVVNDGRYSLICNHLMAKSLLFLD